MTYMGLFRENRPFLMKCFIYSLSAVVALIAAQMVMSIFVVVLYSSCLSDFPTFVRGLICLVGIALSLYVSILCFNGISKYLKNQLKTSRKGGQ